MTKVSVLVSIMFVGACISSVAHAACDSQCQAKASAVGERAAHKLMLPEFGPGGKLGRLIRAEVGLEICGAKRKSEAVTKLRKAHFDEIVKQRIQESPLGSRADSTEERVVEAASFLSTVQALLQGYALGYEHSVDAVVAMNTSTKEVMCGGYREFGDKVLFGDG